MTRRRAESLFEPLVGVGLSGSLEGGGGGGGGVAAYNMKIFSGRQAGKSAIYKCFWKQCQNNDYY